MRQIKPLFTFLIACLTACTSNNTIKGYRTTSDILWEEVDFAEFHEHSSDKVIIDLDFGLDSFSVQQAQLAQQFSGVSVLLDMNNGRYDEVNGDFDMRHFSIAPDKGTLIPYSIEVLKEFPNIEVCVLASSGPSWLDLNQNKEELFQNAFALYLTKFIDNYHKNLIPISTLLLLNSCKWGNSAEGKIMEAMKERGISTIRKEELYIDRNVSKNHPMEDTWQILKRALDKGFPHVGTFLTRTDSPETFQWKKQLLKHLQPLEGHTSNYLKTETNNKILAFQIENEKILFVIWNPYNKVSTAKIAVNNVEHIIQVAPLSLNSFCMNIE
ncbi:MAG: hypothetical protein IJ212_05110 [Bacteroidaceae bacterium]|nr:hypothetical protein [Bacteroidaceae bacterium]